MSIITLQKKPDALEVLYFDGVNLTEIVAFVPQNKASILSSTLSGGNNYKRISNSSNVSSIPSGSLIIDMLGYYWWVDTTGYAFRKNATTFGNVEGISVPFTTSAVLNTSWQKIESSTVAIPTVTTTTENVTITTVTNLD